MATKPREETISRVNFVKHAFNQLELLEEKWDEERDQMELTFSGQRILKLQRLTAHTPDILMSPDELAYALSQVDSMSITSQHNKLIDEGVDTEFKKSIFIKITIDNDHEEEA